jgi:hypothetical protein
MSSALLIRFEPYFAVDASVPVWLTRLGGATGARVRPESRVEIVPLRGQTKIAGLSEGTWLVRATLPNGQLVDTSVALRAGDTPVEAILDAGSPSPNETAAWAYVLQSEGRSAAKRAYTDWRDKSEQAKAHHTRLRAFSKGGLWPPTPTPPPSGPTFAAPAPEPGPDEAVVAVCEGRVPNIEKARPLDTKASPNDDPWATLEGRVEAPAERCLWLLVFSSHGPLAWRIPPGRGWQHVTRFLLRAEARPLETETSSLAPWPGLRVVFDFGNQTALSLLGFLQGGSLDAAHHLGVAFIDEAVDMMAGKFDDFTSAAVAGYFLWRAADWRIGQTVGGVRADKLGGWFSNLDHAFEAHADGAILHGHWLLDNGRAAEARDAFLRAMRRGLPIFSMGLAALNDGLSLCYSSTARGDEDRPVKEALQSLAAVFKLSHLVSSSATCVEWRNPREATPGY